ncbi:MAG TPA: anthranilate synthase component I, partial [Paenibacillus sp.]|nr:anthranilate synthase component I [Paenibacillus sp.]
MEIITTWHEWEQWADEDWSMFPLIIKSPKCSGELPASWEEAWQLASEYSVVLESGKGGRYTYLGLNPVSILK